MSRINRNPTGALGGSQAHSEPELNTSKDETPPKITHRKRLCPSEFSPKDNLDVFKDEMRDMLCTWKMEQDAMLLAWKSGQDSVLKTLTTSITEINTQIKDIVNTNQEIDRSMIFINQSFEEMRQKIDILDQERHEQQVYIQSLESKIEEMERNARAQCVELRNVPPKQKETRDDLLGVLSKLCDTVDMPLEISAVREIYRTRGKPGDDSVRPIVVDLSSCIQKKKLLTAVKLYNTSHKDNKLNSETLGLSGPRVPVYVAEHLTPRGRRLHFLSRGIANTQQYKYCWTENGRVFLRKAEGMSAILIESEKQLETLKM